MVMKIYMVYPCNKHIIGMNKYIMDLCLWIYQEDDWNSEMKILTLQKFECHMGEWYYLVQLRKQHNEKMLLRPKVFNPNPPKEIIYTM
jgi:hypothetical protein